MGKGELKGREKKEEKWEEEGWQDIDKSERKNWSEWEWRDEVDGVGGIGTEDKKELQREESGSSVLETKWGRGGEETKDSEKKVLKDWRYNRKERRKMKN